MYKFCPETSYEIGFLVLREVLEVVDFVGFSEGLGGRDGTENFVWIIRVWNRMFVVLVSTKVFIGVPLDGKGDLLLFEEGVNRGDVEFRHYSSD